MPFDITLDHYTWTPNETSFRFNDIATLTVMNSIVPCPVDKKGVQEISINSREKKIKFKRHTYDLTEKEIAAVEEQVEKLIASSAAIFYTYDPDRDNAFNGPDSLSSIYRSGLETFVPIAPPKNASYWNSEKKEWQTVYAVIYDDGHWSTNVSGICPSCAVFFTEEEWNNQEKIPSFTDVWDFTQEKWVDGRDIEEIRSIKIFDLVEEKFPTPGANGPMEDVDYLIEGPENAHIIQEFARYHSGEMGVGDMFYTKIFAEGLGRTVESIVEEYSEKISEGLKTRAQKTAFLLKVRSYVNTTCTTINEIDRLTLADFE